MPGSWKHLRAAVITIALIAHLIYALPLPRPLSESDLRKPWRQDDIRMWRGWLEVVGVELTQDEMGGFLRGWTGFWGDLHDGMKAPFKPLFKHTSTNQSWALFAAATQKPERLVVQYQDSAGEWHVLLRRLDPPHDWREAQFRHRRIRGIWDGVRDTPGVPYQNLTHWIARLVFTEFHDAQVVKVFLERRYATFPWEEDDPRVEVRVPREHKRTDEMGE